MKDKALENLIKKRLEQLPLKQICMLELYFKESMMLAYSLGKKNKK